MSEEPQDPEKAARDNRLAVCIGVGMMLGTSIGSVLGLLLFDDVALGIGPGIGIGMALGVAVAVGTNVRDGSD